jgi:hypothetical protein
VAGGVLTARTGPLARDFLAGAAPYSAAAADVNGDARNEADETFFLELFGLSSNALFTRNSSLGTILNDD